jgi:hypothetical protein
MIAQEPQRCSGAAWSRWSHPDGNDLRSKELEAPFCRSVYGNRLKCVIWIVLPLTKCSRRIRAIVSTTSIP